MFSLRYQALICIIRLNSHYNEKKNVAKINAIQQNGLKRRVQFYWKYFFAQPCVSNFLKQMRARERLFADININISILHKKKLTTNNDRNFEANSVEYNVATT